LSLYDIAGQLSFINPTHKRTEGRAPVWALSLLQKTRTAVRGMASANSECL
jgi:hypothetical protein